MQCGLTAVTCALRGKMAGKSRTCRVCCLPPPLHLHVHQQHCGRLRLESQPRGSFPRAPGRRRRSCSCPRLRLAPAPSHGPLCLPLPCPALCAASSPSHSQSAVLVLPRAISRGAPLALSWQCFPSSPTAPQTALSCWRWWTSAWATRPKSGATFTRFEPARGQNAADAGVAWQE